MRSKAKASTTPEETIARMRQEHEAIGKVIDALASIPSDAKRLRVVAAVATLYGHDREAAIAIAAAQEHEDAETAEEPS